MMKSIMKSQFMDLFSVFRLGKNEKLIYELLEKKPMTIKQLQKTTQVSERMLRTYLDDMIERGFVKKKVVEGNRLKYLYKATEPQTILEQIKTKVNELEKDTKRAKKEIIRGSKF